MKICVIGLGYIGLPTASILAVRGYEVVGVDIDKKRLKEIKNLSFKTTEKDLLTLVSGAIKSGNLEVKDKPEEADVFIVCVPTPLKNKKCDLSYIKNAVESIKPLIKDKNLVIIESTVPPGTCEEIYKMINKDIYLAYCPERVLPGNILHELINNDRIIGGINKESAIKAKKIYESFVKGNIYLTDTKTAETVKLMENIYRDVNIALANEFAKIAEELNIDVWEAINLANKHPRVNILKPGPGVGGHCISIDPWFLVEKSKEAKLIKTAREINDEMPIYVANKIKKLAKKTVTIFGVTYKGNVDDTRESPAEKIIDELLKDNYDVRCYDRYARDFKYPLLNLEESVKDSELIVVLADHDEYKNFKEEDIKRIGKLMKRRVIYDTRNIINKDLWKNEDFKIYILGGKND
ncbi:nucleotide sugar dehydrogenase [Methanocaldococcus indicus]|uniref:nucleotide sugar dehydrogenase n=1 Tax=Methanocaldococcus indicus TaxID=213231 RepID=UPI003C6CF349